MSGQHVQCSQRSWAPVLAGQQRGHWLYLSFWQPYLGIPLTVSPRCLEKGPSLGSFSLFANLPACVLTADETVHSGSQARVHLLFPCHPLSDFSITF